MNFSKTSSGFYTIRRWKRTTIYIAGICLAIGIFYWILNGILKNWDYVSSQLLTTSPSALITALALMILCFTCLSFGYVSCLRMANANIHPLAAMRILIASQLGKYLPGKIFLIVGQIVLCKQAGFSMKQCVIAFLAHQIFTVSVAVLISIPLLVKQTDYVSLILVSCSVVGLIVLASGIWIRPVNALQRWRNKPELVKPSLRVMIEAILWIAGAWICYGGCTMALTIELMPELDPLVMMRIGIASVAAWLIGFLSLITPSGIGIREGSFVLLVRALIPEPTAMIVALIMRILWTFFELVVGTIALIFSLVNRSTITYRE